MAPVYPRRHIYFGVDKAAKGRCVISDESGTTMFGTYSCARHPDLRMLTDAACWLCPDLWHSASASLVTIAVLRRYTILEMVSSRKQQAITTMYVFHKERIVEDLSHKS